MIQMTLAQAASILGVPSVSTTHREFSGFCIDTRILQPDNLFIALSGSQTDGHQFVKNARDKGAAAALVQQAVDADLPQLVVQDTVAALGQLAGAWRQQFSLPIVAVTGSNGKTTLKNMIAAIMIAACRGDGSKVLSTQGTFNNHLGLPLTLGQLNKQHRFAAIEMGMNHFGEIEYLTKLTQPTVAVISNAAAAHLEGVGDLAGVARAKGEIFSGLTAGGTAVLNHDDAFYDYWHNLIGHHTVISFGLNSGADVTASMQEGTHAQHIALNSPKGSITIHLPLLGRHNAQNALAAAAAALALNISLDDIKTGLESIQPANGRLQIHRLENGVQIIDDSYNANPFSLQAAVETLSSFAGKKILVLGDMRELGSNEKDIHQTAGENIRRAGIDYLFTYGSLSLNTSQAFGEGAYHFNEQEKLVNALKPFLYNQTTILVKGSRSMHMERVVNELLQHPAS